MANTCVACGFSNLSNSKFCCQCGAMLAVEVHATWHELAQVTHASSRTPSHHSLSQLSHCRSTPSGSTFPAGAGMTRSGCSRLQAAGSEWRKGKSGQFEPDGPFGPEAFPKVWKLESEQGPATEESEAQAPSRKESQDGSLAPSQERWTSEARRFIMVTELPCSRPFPRILCVARRHQRKNKYVDITGEYHLDLIQKFGGAPIILPRTVKTFEQLTEYLPMDGLVIAEGNDLSDDVLLKYGCSLPERLNDEAAKKFASDTELDVSKDELEFALMRFALAAGVPILTFCRGSQMLNCLRGGTLIGDIETQTDSTIRHLRDSSEPDYDSFRHPISVTANTPLAEWFADSLEDGSDELLVNSYHHQASKDLGSNLVAMAHAPDGMIEGFYDPSYDPKRGQFVVGLQFHPERMLDDYPGCERCYQSFLEASKVYKAVQDA